MSGEEFISMSLLLCTLDRSLPKTLHRAGLSVSMSGPLGTPAISKHGAGLTGTMSGPLGTPAISKQKRRVATLLDLEAAIGRRHSRMTTQKKSVSFYDCQRQRSARHDTLLKDISHRKLPAMDEYLGRDFDQSLTDDVYNSDTKEDSSPSSSALNEQELWYVDKSIDRTLSKTKKNDFKKFLARNGRNESGLSLDHRKKHAATGLVNSGLNAIVEEEPGLRKDDPESGKLSRRRRTLHGVRSNGVPRSRPITPTTSPNNGREASLHYTGSAAEGSEIYGRVGSGALSRDKSDLCSSDSPLHVRSYMSMMREDSETMEQGRCVGGVNSSTIVCHNHSTDQKCVEVQPETAAGDVGDDVNIEKRLLCESTVENRRLRSFTKENNCRRLKNMSGNKLEYDQATSTTPMLKHKSREIKPQLSQMRTSSITQELGRRSIGLDIHRRAYVTALAEANKRKFYSDPLMFRLNTSRPYVYSFYDAVCHGLVCARLKCPVKRKHPLLPPISKTGNKNPSKLLFGDVKVDDYYPKTKPMS